MEDCKLISWNVASLGSLRKAVDKNSHKLSSVGLVALGTVVSGSGLSEDEVVGAEELSERSSADGHIPPLETYFDLLRGDIIALQEVKIELAKLKSTAGEDGGVAYRFSSSWEAFFNPCRDKEVGIGFNGVATYVKTKGACRCVRADWRGLGDEELDRMGRCLVTDHGKFVLFNVYAPCSGGASGDIKLR